MRSYPTFAPEFHRLSLWAWDRLNQSQQGLGLGHRCHVILAVGGLHFQLVTICNQLTALLGQPVLQDLPVVLGGLVIGLVYQDLDDVDHREPPGLRGIIIEPADLMLLEQRGGGKECAHGFSGLACRRQVTASSATRFGQHTMEDMEFMVK